jgi:hypothetical protein
MEMQVTSSPPVCPSSMSSSVHVSVLALHTPRVETPLSLVGVPSTDNETDPKQLQKHSERQSSRVLGEKTAPKTPHTPTKFPLYSDRSLSRGASNTPPSPSPPLKPRHNPSSRTLFTHQPKKRTSLPTLPSMSSLPIARPCLTPDRLLGRAGLEPHVPSVVVSAASLPFPGNDNPDAPRSLTPDRLKGGAGRDAVCKPTLSSSASQALVSTNGTPELDCPQGRARQMTGEPPSRTSESDSSKGRVEQMATHGMSKSDCPLGGAEQTSRRFDLPAPSTDAPLSPLSFSPLDSFEPLISQNLSDSQATQLESFQPPVPPTTQEHNNKAQQSADEEVRGLSHIRGGTHQPTLRGLTLRGSNLNESKRS